MSLNERIQLTLVDNFIWLIDAGLYLIFTILNPKGFLTLQNVEFILYTSSMIGFLVLAEAVVLLTGNMDLSLAQIAGFSAIIASFMLGVKFTGLPGWVGIVIILAAGGLLGGINGLLVGGFGYNAFLATLGTYIGFEWATYWIRRGAIVNLPKVFLAPGDMQVGGVHIAIFLFIAASVLLHLLLTRTEMGLNIHATGGNPNTTKMMGINVGSVLFWAFVLTGVLSSVSGLLYVGYVGACTSLIANGEIFNAFAGAIIGGVSLKGGRGTMVGAFGGIIMLGILDAGLTMLNVAPEIRGVLKGVVLVAAIAINMVVTKMRDRILMPS